VPSDGVVKLTPGVAEGRHRVRGELVEVDRRRLEEVSARAAPPAGARPRFDRRTASTHVRAVHQVGDPADVVGPTVLSPAG
jgi:hypothetical protein